LPVLKRRCKANFQRRGNRRWRIRERSWLNKNEKEYCLATGRRRKLDSLRSESTIAGQIWEKKLSHTERNCVDDLWRTITVISEKMSETRDKPRELVKRNPAEETPKCCPSKRGKKYCPGRQVREGEERDTLRTSLRREESSANQRRA